MNNAFVQQYQTRVLGPSQTVEYSTIIRNLYPPQAVHQEPFIGIKVLCTDTNAYVTTPDERIRYIESNMGFLRGKGCIIRETAANKPDGFWIITLPVPKSQLKDQLNKLGHVLSILENNFGIVYQDIIDINISGRCPLIYTEQALSQVVIPKMYQQYMMQTDNSPYKIGYPIRINDEYVLLKTRWGLPRQDMFENITVIESCIQNMFK